MSGVFYKRYEMDGVWSIGVVVLWDWIVLVDDWSIVRKQGRGVKFSFFNFTLYTMLCLSFALCHLENIDIPDK